MGGAAMADDDDFASPPPAPRARAEGGGGGVYQVGGVPVEFPYKPYGTQLAFMGRVIATLDRARRQGRSHALLESPTGTGKSLSLLLLRARLAAALPAPLPSRPPPPIHSSTAEDSSPMIPSRRRRQASRKHYCVNKFARASDNIDEQCKSLLDKMVQGCPEFKNAQKLSRHPSLQIGGCYEVHDIEDLVRVGQKAKGCPYFAAQHMAEAAQLVFCPYNYLISPVVRRAMDIDISGSIIILDEAHNIEDIARDAGSVDIDEESLCLLQGELQNLATDEAVAMIYQPLHDIIQGLIGWIAEREDNLHNHEFGHPASYWTGEKAMNELQRAGISPMYFLVLQECATKAIKAASDTESDGSHLSGGRAMTLESLFSSLSYFFGQKGRNSCDYQLALQRFVKKEGNDEISSRCTMSLWCLNPAVVFQEIADRTLSVILTSGTLSPMGSFTSELGVQFEACMEAPHVINADSQVFAAVLSSGPTRQILNASYKTVDNSSFQDELGASLEEICRIVPGGALVFFPSYKLLDKLQVRWSQTGQWARLNAQKHVFVEPKGSSEELDPVLKGYYDAILGKAPVKKARGDSKQIVKNRVTKKSSQESAKAGAALLAVCRGKVSEGIDFVDDNARVVVIVGIPFPNINDVQVKLKKRYNDSYNSSKHLLSGSEWYCHQAFRALNQAAGHCIRHKSDYGGIILIDCGIFPKVKLDSEAPQSLSDDKRKLPWPELSSSNHSVSQCNQKVSSLFTCTGLSRCENVKLERNYKPEEVSAKKSMQKKLLISCIRCKTALGLEEDGFLVTCTQSSSSKLYLAYLLRHGLSAAGFLEDDFSASTPAEVRVVECEASSLNQNIFGKFRNQGHVWSAKDGCVYNAMTCTFCSSENKCAMVLGVQVLATDKLNQQLVEKVLLFSDRLDVQSEPSKGQISRTRRDASDSISPPSPSVIDLESFAYKPLKKDPVALNSRRSKVRMILMLHQHSRLLIRV
ncbi:unnamed protein product [Miscanthus lutarioriparius]|uniref:DNA 5'-3' helicase FANCJ n=1 Tax=Miscanthus lutarioriparius TaxID=422564 RepID=A0A811NL18_9POAL|nr:unnamed protein product [Miscanthus lutarioriparius]